MFSIGVLLLSFLGGNLSGFLISLFVRRTASRTEENREDVEIGGPQAQQNDAKQFEVDRLVRSIYDLTSQVDSQVGRHSQKVNEITNTLSGTESEIGDSDQILVVGQMLIHANEKLQTDLEEAKMEIRRQREQLNSTIAESQTDPLTGLANRRALDLEYARTFAQSRREQSNLSVLIVDIDHFKKVNDKYGHMVGDQMIKNFARCLKNTFRDSDFVSRFGGEEFVVLLKKTSLEDAIKAAERVRSVIAANHQTAGDFDIKITASFGIKEVCENDSEEEVLQMADEALYAAKRSGRNCCFFHDGNSCQQAIFEPVLGTCELIGQADPISASDVEQFALTAP